MNVQAESFHLNSHIIGFRLQTQKKLDSPYKTPSNTGSEGVKTFEKSKSSHIYWTNDWELMAPCKRTQHRWTNNDGSCCVRLPVAYGTIREFNMSLRRRRRQRELPKSKTTTLHVHHAFLYISLPSLHDNDVNCLISRFVDNVNIRRRISLGSL